MEQNQYEMVSAGKETISNPSPLHFNYSISTTLQNTISATVSSPDVRQNVKPIYTAPLIMQNVGYTSKEGRKHICKVSAQSNSGIESSEFSKHAEEHQLVELDITGVQNFHNKLEMLPMVREMDYDSSNEVLLQPTEKVHSLQI